MVAVNKSALTQLDHLSVRVTQALAYHLMELTVMVRKQWHSQDMAECGSYHTILNNKSLEFVNYFVRIQYATDLYNHSYDSQ